MDANLDKIALDLYGKIQTRFSDIKIGDENGKVLSKKQDIPNARFFEFEYTEDGEPLGTIAVTLDSDDGVVVQISGDLVNDDDNTTHHGAYKFIRSFRQFAKDRLLNFDIQNIGKSNLDKRDYDFQAKRKEEPMTDPIMENKMFGTTKVSYQDLGEARLIVKHSQPINTDLAAGRTMHIENIYIENAVGERFRYPFKHLNGARALAEHIKAGGNPYDGIGKHICGLSEELAQLRKFKGYVGRQEQLSEAMSDITSKVMERIEQVKKEVHQLQRPSYYQQFAESFQESEERIIPEEVKSDWINRLTLRTFNEELTSAFPFIYKLVDESELPVLEVNAEDILSEGDFPTFADIGKMKLPSGNMDREYQAKVQQACIGGRGTGMMWQPDPRDIPFINSYRQKAGIRDWRSPSTPNFEATDTVEKDEKGNVKSWKHEGDWKKATNKDPRGRVTNMSDVARRKTEKIKELYPEEAFEEFLEDIIREDKDEIFSPNKDAQHTAIEKLNQIVSKELKGGPEGVNASQSLKGLIDDPEFIQSLQDIDPDLDVRPLVQQYILQRDPEVATQVHFGSEGGAKEPEAPPPAPPEAAAPAPAAPPPEAPPAPDAMAAAAPPAPAPEAPAAPIAESANRLAKLKAKFIKAKECGAKLDTPMKLGGRSMTLLSAIEECGMTPMECGFTEDDGSGDTPGVQQIKKSIIGFWNPEEDNLTIGGTRAKIKVIKSFKDGEFPDASEDDVRQVLAGIEEADPSSNPHSQEKTDILRLAGVKNNDMDEGQDEADLAQLKQLMAQFGSMKDMPNAKVTRTSSGTINGQDASYDDVMNKVKGMKLKFGDDELDFSNPDDAGQKMQKHVGSIFQGMQGKMPNQNVQFPGGQMNPADMMKDIMGKINFGK